MPALLPLCLRACACALLLVHYMYAHAPERACACMHTSVRTYVTANGLEKDSRAWSLVQRPPEPSEGAQPAMPITMFCTCKHAGVRARLCVWFFFWHTYAYACAWYWNCTFW